MSTSPKDVDLDGKNLSMLLPTSAQHSNSKFGKTGPGLLDLPRELRDHILHQILIKPQNTVTMLMDSDYYRNEVSAAPPGICNVNRQLRQETLPVYYSRNTFSAQLDNEMDLETAKRWVWAIGEGNFRYLRKIALYGWTKVPSSENMSSRRWVRVVLNLKDVQLEMESAEHTLRALEQPPELINTIEELQKAFRDLIDLRESRPFDAKSIQMVMDGFNSLCSGY